VYDIICRYKYVTDFVNVGIKLLNIERKETKDGRTGNLVVFIGLFFHEVAQNSYIVSLQAVH